MDDRLADDEAAKAKAHAALAQLPIRRPWSIEQFVAEVGMMHDRAIILDELPKSVSGVISGLWVPTDRADIVFVKHGAEGEYREHVICHEIGHMVFAHQMAGPDLIELLKETFHRIAPDISPDMVERLADPRPCLARDNFLQPIEREAEWLATLIMNKAAEMRDPLYPDSDTMTGAERAVLTRLANAIGWSG